MSDKSEFFKEYCKKNNKDYDCQSSWEEKIFNDQQKKIDELERYKKHYDELFSRSIVVDTDEYSAMVQKLQAAEEEIKELQEQSVADIAIREKLMHENKILREAVESIAKDPASEYNMVCEWYSELKEEARQALEKVGGGE